MHTMHTVHTMHTLHELHSERNYMHGLHAAHYCSLLNASIYLGHTILHAINVNHFICWSMCFLWVKSKFKFTVTLLAVSKHINRELGLFHTFVNRIRTPIGLLSICFLLRYLRAYEVRPNKKQL